MQKDGASLSGPGSRASHEALRSSPKASIPSADGLSNAAKCLLGGWFSGMKTGGGSDLTLGLRESAPRDWVVAALKELIAAEIISVRALNKYGGLVFVPLVDCRWALEWMLKGGDKTAEARSALTEQIKSPRHANTLQRDILDYAQAIEARRAETSGSVEDESAVAESDAPEHSQDNHNAR